MDILGHEFFLSSTLPICTDFFLIKKALDYDLASYMASYMGLPKEKNKSDDHMQFNFPLLKIGLSLIGNTEHGFDDDVICHLRTSTGNECVR